MMKDSVINSLLARPLPGPVRAGEPGPEAVPPEAQGSAVGGRSAPPAAAAAGKESPAASAPAASMSEAPEPPEQDLSGVVESLNSYLQSVQRDLQFSVDDVSGRTVITVVDRENKEIIRQIPPEAVMALADTLREGGEFGSFGVAEKA